MKTLSPETAQRANLALSAAIVVLALLALLRFPADAAESARTGLALCARTIIPSLLPFFVLSGLFSAAGLPSWLARRLAPLSRFLPIPAAAFAPLVLGLTGGYPIGAATVAELVKSGELSPEDGERLLPFCNNTGPAFIVGAAGVGIFGASKWGLLLYAAHILAALCLAFLFSRKENAPPPEPAASPGKNPAAALPGAMKNAVSATVNICGYVVFFSIITGLLEAAGLFSSLAGNFASLTGLELHFCRSLLQGLLELGSGIGSLAGLPPTGLDLALAAFILGFGSLSVHCQTLAVIDGTEMGCARHFAGRILHGVLSALFVFLFFPLFR